MAVRAIGKVAESYMNKEKPHSTIVYNRRISTVKTMDTVSFLTLQGRITVAMTVCNYYVEIINNGNRVRRQADLCLVDNIFYLILVVELPNTLENVKQ